MAKVHPEQTLEAVKTTSDVLQNLLKPIRILRLSEVSSSRLEERGVRVVADLLLFSEEDLRDKFQLPFEERTQLREKLAEMGLWQEMLPIWMPRFRDLCEGFVAWAQSRHDELVSFTESSLSEPASSCIPASLSLPPEVEGPPECPSGDRQYHGYKPDGGY